MYLVVLGVVLHCGGVLHRPNVVVPPVAASGRGRRESPRLLARTPNVVVLRRRHGLADDARGLWRSGGLKNGVQVLVEDVLDGGRGPERELGQGFGS